ncbi:YtxH domain-containing protein [Alkalinema pantanalense CENA528]|uniref:YtxH domain-containing protein n=1 Tax=Alkalinema pantanalense TaxID=1620705 RepID=UPI003D70212A
MAGNRSGAFISGLLIGAAAGAIAGLLTAPRTGRETRKLLKKSADALPELAEDLSTTVQIQADRLSETALKNWDETLHRLRVAIAAGVEASQRVREDLQVDPEDTAAEPEAAPVSPRRYIGEIK